MQHYTITVELDRPASTYAGPEGDKIISALADMHPVIGRSGLGRGELILTLPAETLKQATILGLALVAELPTSRISVETSDDFDARTPVDVPHLLSITEAAQHLGITRAGVQKRIDAGTLAAVRIGNMWAVPAAAVSS